MHVRAFAQQCIDGGQVAIVRGPMQCRCAVGFRSIHIHMLFQKCTDGLGVLVLDRIHERGISIRGGEGGNRQQRRE